MSKVPSETQKHYSLQATRILGNNRVIGSGNGWRHYVQWAVSVPSKLKASSQLEVDLALGVS